VIGKNALRSRSRGFTLLEVLVVLVIVGLISAVLMQAMGAIMHARTSVAAAVLNLDTVVLQRSIISEPISGIMPEYPNQPSVFRGTSEDLQGLTIRPAGDIAGGPEPFHLTFERRADDDTTALIYVGCNNEKRELARWSGSRGEFSYLGVPGGDWSDQWPVGTMPSQTPMLVRIETGLPGNETIVAFIDSPHERTLRLSDVFATDQTTPP
jgi:prepilin-type N-terminal cleavage/methylation domain-containing protein